MTTLPWTPDFDVWAITHQLLTATIHNDSVIVTWSDNQKSAYCSYFLRENSPDEKTIHPLSRELLITIAHLPDNLTATAVEIDEAGALVVHWPDNLVSRYHPGWLRAHSYFDNTDTPAPAAQPILWNAQTLPKVPEFNGNLALQDKRVFLAWLEALRDYGVACLKGLPQQDGLLEEVIQRIGVIRESNFGRIYSLVIKDDPDSNAYTSGWLQQHMDLGTRECPPGLQFLYCRENTTTGGEGVYSDAYQIAEDIRREEPHHFNSLTTDNWSFNNRAKNNDYRASGPIIDTDKNGQICAIRYTPWLNSPIIAPLSTQQRMYAAYRAFSKRNDDPKYHLYVRYQPGDLFAFDNRRAMHGRKGYDAKGGKRFIEGAYSDRDELHSCIRTIHRQLRHEKITTETAT